MNDVFSPSGFDRRWTPMCVLLGLDRDDGVHGGADPEVLAAAIG